MLAVSKSARRKIRRANDHIQDIIKNSNPLSKDLYQIVNGPDRSLAVLYHNDCFSINYKTNEDISAYFSSIIGDAVNNLRESLDYWINAALIAVNRQKKVHFPFAADWSALKSSPGYRELWKLFPELAEFIGDEIRPCRNTELKLWAATSLCNQNKHNDFVPTVTVLNIENINMRTREITMNNCTMSVNANKNHTLMRSRGPIFIGQDYIVRVGIIFPSGAVFDGLPVVDTLTDMSNTVCCTIERLDNFLGKYL